MNENAPPVNAGDELEVVIDSVGAKGDGIAKVNGFVIFVPNTRKGDSVKIKITKVLRSVGFGEVVGKAEKQEETEDEPKENYSEPSYEDSEDFGEEK